MELASQFSAIQVQYLQRATSEGYLYLLIACSVLINIGPIYPKGTRQVVTREVSRFTCRNASRLCKTMIFNLFYLIKVK